MIEIYKVRPGEGDNDFEVFDCAYDAIEYVKDLLLSGETRIDIRSELMDREGYELLKEN